MTDMQRTLTGGGGESITKDFRAKLHNPLFNPELIPAPTPECLPLIYIESLRDIIKMYRFHLRIPNLTEMVFPIFKDSNPRNYNLIKKNPPFSKAKMLNQRTGFPAVPPSLPTMFFKQTVNLSKSYNGTTGQS
ncbi:MAG: hypothetical protein Ct9H300mP19_09150 [Dehalococcoidia bacterium]|nr:MAG: hypothetical protein Ct9H300mP19_09150 [Dehalococcoidia bacterium]